MKTSLGALLGLTMLFAGCGPEPVPETLPAPRTPAAVEDNRVQALAPPDSCNELEDIGWCRIRTDRIWCDRGQVIYAYPTPDGYCIRTDACARFGGPGRLCQL
jgi:hypothetical protein